MNRGIVVYISIFLSLTVFIRKFFKILYAIDLSTVAQNGVLTNQLLYSFVNPAYAYIINGSTWLSHYNR